MTDYGWQDHGNCVNSPQVTHDDFFFDGRFHNGSPNYKKHVAMLRAICRDCPVRQQCDEYADETETRFGFWAGLTEEERRTRRRRKAPHATGRMTAGGRS